MQHSPIRWTRAVFPTALVLFLVVFNSGEAVAADRGAPDARAPKKKVQRLGTKAHKAYEAGNFVDAERLYGRLREMKPEEPRFAAAHAATLARLGRRDEAYRALDDAAALGLIELGLFERDPELESLRVEARFGEVHSRVERNAESNRKALRAAGDPARPDEAPSFATWALLEEALERERLQLERRQGWPSWNAWWIDKSRTEQRQLAAMARYVDEHANAVDREQAILGELRRRIEVAAPWNSYWRTDEATAIREAADRYLAAFGDSADRHEVALYRAVAAVRGVVDPQDDRNWETDPLPKLRCEEGRVELEALANDAAAGKWSEDALGFSAVCAAQAEPVDEKAARAKIDRFLSLPDRSAQDRTPFQALRGEVRVERIRVGGLPAFEVTSLDGTRFSPAALQGKVALIEFWAPG